MDATLYATRENETLVMPLDEFDDIVTFGSHNDAIDKVIINFKNNFETRRETITEKFSRFRAEEKSDLFEINNQTLIQRMLQFVLDDEVQICQNPITLKARLKCGRKK